jgi:hypothetical protein
MSYRSVLFGVFLIFTLFSQPALALDTQRCGGRLLKVGDFETQADALCGRPYFVDSWEELIYTGLDARRSLRQRIAWSDRYFDPGAGRMLFRVRSRQGQIVAIDSLVRRGGPADAGDCTLATLQRRQSVGEIVHRCGLPSRRIDLGLAVVSEGRFPELTQDLRQEQWLYPADSGQTLVVEVQQGRLVSADWR